MTSLLQSTAAHSRGYVCVQCTFRLTRAAKRPISQRFLQRKIEEDLAWKQEGKLIRAGKKKSMLTQLEERGLVKQIAGDRNNLDLLMTSRPVPVYAGFDPTAPALHIGHMLPMMILLWLYINGFPAFYLVGGTTARVGDPTDRLKPRDAVGRGVRNANMVSMHDGVKRLWKRMESYASTLHGYEYDKAWLRGQYNNASWYNKLTIVDFIRELGDGAKMASLLSRDSVKMRLEQGTGMTLAEFMYPTLQAWDWFELYRQRGVQVQIGGSDQYGNLVTGMEVVKHMASNWSGEAHLRDKDPQLFGITTPLLTTPSGEKIGKSAGNAIWLDANMTSSWELYQHFVRLPDSQVEGYLKKFTLIPLERIVEIMKEHNKDPSQRSAQKALAFDFVYLAHGKAEAEAAQRETDRVFRSGDQSASLSAMMNDARDQRHQPTHPTFNDPAYQKNPHHNPFSDLPVLNEFAKPIDANSNMATVRLPRSFIENNNFNAVLCATGITQSKGEAHRLIAAKGAYVGGQNGNIRDQQDQFKWAAILDRAVDGPKKYIVDNTFMFLRVGKWRIKTVRIVEDEEWDRVTGRAALGESERGEITLQGSWAMMEKMQKSWQRKDVTLEEAERVQVEEFVRDRDQNEKKAGKIESSEQSGEKQGQDANSAATAVEEAKIVDLEDAKRRADQMAKEMLENSPRSEHRKRKKIGAGISSGAH